MADKIKNESRCGLGAIAQLGERIVRNDEVVGSIPTSSTNLFRYLATFCGHRRTDLLETLRCRQANNP